MSEAQTPVEPVQPASRLGEIVGWSLLALAVVCFIAFIFSAKQADDWSHAMWHAAEFKAAYAAYNETMLLKYLWVSATFAFLQLIPGLLYAMKPSLLGGPWGRLLRLARRSSTKLTQRQPRRHPVTCYQGIGLAFISIGPIGVNLLLAVGTFFRGPSWLFFGVLPLALLLNVTSFFIGLSLFGEARWWFLSGKEATHEQERPQA